MAKGTPKKKGQLDEDLREDVNDLRKRGLVDDLDIEEEMEMESTISDDEASDPDLQEFDLRGDGHIPPARPGRRVSFKGDIEKDIDDDDGDENDEPLYKDEEFDLGSDDDEY